MSMSPPKFTSQISLGNIIQGALLIVGCASAFAVLQAKSGENERRIIEIERRVVNVEQSAVSLAVATATITANIEEIKRQQRENNELLRELLRQVASGKL